jgi:hypothetical protein
MSHLTGLPAFRAENGGQVVTVRAATGEPFQTIGMPARAVGLVVLGVNMRPAFSAFAN